MIIKNNITNSKSTLIFDIDGTLVTYNTMHDLVSEALSDVGMTPTEDLIKKQTLGVIDILNRASKEQCFDFYNLCLAWEKSFAFKNLDVTYLTRRMLELETKYVQIIPGVKETLDNLDYNMICSTNWLRESQIKKLYKVDLLSYFKRIYTCEDTYAKPNPNHFKYILEKQGLSSDNCVMIGDSSSDLTNVMDSILVDYNQDKEYLYDKADTVITDIKDLQYVLKR